MLSTRALDVSEVPDRWVFEHFAGLRLQGAEARIHSLFNPNDRTPSMYIFWSERLGKYWFHDFSTGKTGDAIKLVQALFECSYGDACSRIVKAYMIAPAWEPAVTGSMVNGKKFQVTNYELRSWNQEDAAYWTSFHIDSHLLESYGVRPLDGYSMENKEGEHFTTNGGYLYGYFTGEGRLYKIYRPKRIQGKFVKVGAYLQGADQLKDRRCLLIVSSLKDGMSMRSLQLDADFVAPDSENSLLTPPVIDALKHRYKKKVFVLLDRDEAGIYAMKEYRRRYGLTPLLLALEKDLSDSIRRYGALYVRDRLVPMIDRRLNDANPMNTHF